LKAAVEQQQAEVAQQQQEAQRRLAEVKQQEAAAQERVTQAEAKAAAAEEEAARWDTLRAVRLHVLVVCYIVCSFRHHPPAHCWDAST
jgi:hypothetical protein